MDKTIVRTSEAPAAIGPYSQAVTVQVGDKRMVFTSGQIALDPKTGAMIEGEVDAQTRKVLANLKAVLAEAGATFQQVVKTTIFLANMDGGAGGGGGGGGRGPGGPPARAAGRAARRPRGAGGGGGGGAGGE